MILLTRQLVI